MSRVLKNRISELIAIKSRQENRSRRLSNRQVAEETGLSIVTVNQYVKNNVERFDKKTLEVFANYFGCNIGDILVMEDEPSPKVQSPLLSSLQA